MRIKTFGAATSAAFAAAAMLAIPATAHAEEPSIDWNSPVKLTVTREADKSITAKIDNPTNKDINCTVTVGDENYIESMSSLLRKYNGDLTSAAPTPENVDKYNSANLNRKIIGSAQIYVEQKKAVERSATTPEDDQVSKPAGYASCFDADNKPIFVTTVGSSPLGSFDIGGSLGGSGSLGSLGL